MKVILKNASLVFQAQAQIEWRNLTVSNCSTNTQQGDINVNSDQSSPTPSSRYASPEYIEIANEANFKVGVTGYSSQTKLIIYYYDANKDYIGKTGAAWTTFVDFTSGQAYNVFDDFDVFSHYESNEDVSVSKATLQANAKYFRVLLRNPAPTDAGSSVTIAVG
jgi:hypothetical protein